MKYNNLILLPLCLFFITYGTQQGYSANTLNETGHILDQNLNPEEIASLKNVSQTTFDKIQKGQPLEFTDVMFMQHSGIKSDTIIRILISTQSKFNLTTAEVIQLQNKGVSFKVINFMIRTRLLASNDSTVPESPQPEPKNAIAPKTPVTTTENKSKNCSVTLGALVEQVRITGSQYAYTKNANATGTGAMPGYGETLTPSFNLDWGITAGLAYHFEEKDWTLSTRFDWLSSTGKGSYSVNGSDNVIPINIWRDQFLSSLNADLGVAGYGSSSFKVSYFNLNVDLDKIIYTDKNFTLEPHIGLKLSFIYDTVNTTFTGNGSDTSLSPSTRLGSNILTREQNTNFWGVGPGMGFNSDWNIKNGFSLFLEGTGALLIGKSLAKDSVSYSALSNSATNSSSWNLPTLSPTIQALLGLKYERSFYNNTQKISAKLGWDNSFYWNQWNHVNTVSASTYSSSMDTFQLQEGNTFGLTGILFNLSWMF